MKKLILLMMLSSTIHAHTCTVVPGDIIVNLSQIDNDALIEYSMKLQDPYYPQGDLFSLEIRACFDSDCGSSKMNLINPPQGFLEQAKYRIKSHSLSKGDHTFLYEMLIPRYGCDVKAKTIIKIY